MTKKNILKQFLILMISLIVLSRIYEYIKLKYQTKKQTIPYVRIIEAKAPAHLETITFPGTLSGWHDAPLYARAEGYLKEWYVDIGYHVKKNDVLAIIERPELDAKYQAAKDYLDVMQANNKLAKITKDRWNKLVVYDAVSRQANDDKSYNALAISNATNQAQATLNSLQAYVSFEKIIAPFDGVISDRRTDIGHLINIGSKPDEIKPLFRITQTNPLRLYVNIPQTYAPQIKQNIKYSIQLDEYPEQTFKAQLLKTAEAIDPITMTLQCEFKVENPQNILLPGAFSTIHFLIPHPPSTVILPANTIIFQAAGLQVARVNNKNEIELKNIDISKDYGNKIQIDAVIKPGDKIVLNPPDTLYNGEIVYANA